MQYTKNELRSILKDHGHEPVHLDSGWLMFATQLAMLDKLDQILNK